MENKTDKSLLEVLEMKDKNYEDFKSSGFSSYIDFINSEMNKISKERKYFIEENKVFQTKHTL